MRGDPVGVPTPAGSATARTGSAAAITVHAMPCTCRIEELLDDLITFANRDDLPTLVQATVAHAQFESIHPFGDGNGRTGRALIGAILRRRGVTRNTVVPVASGLLARRDDYFDALGSYRAGRLRPLLELMLRSAVAAAEEGRASMQRSSGSRGSGRSRRGCGADPPLPS